MVHDDVYVSLDIEQPHIFMYQQDACAQFAVQPRPELHLTLGYLGTVGESALDALYIELSRRLRPFDLNEVIVSGVGGAFDDGAVQPLRSSATDDWNGSSRVLWWVVERSPLLVAARRELREALNSIGIDDQFVQTDFQPHITIGSARGLVATPDDLVWDVHGVAKGVTLPDVPFPMRVSVQRSHLTKTTLNPQSLRVLADYDQGRGAVLWITGMPASGKSTVGRSVSRLLTTSGISSLILDSDEIRLALHHDGYDEADRTRFYDSLIRLSNLLRGQGQVVITAATTPIRLVRDEIRHRIPSVLIAHVATPAATCRGRDPKRLYQEDQITFAEFDGLHADIVLTSSDDEEGIADIVARLRTEIV